MKSLLESSDSLGSSRSFTQHDGVLGFLSLLTNGFNGLGTGGREGFSLLVVLEVVLHFDVGGVVACFESDLDLAGVQKSQLFITCQGFARNSVLGLQLSDLLREDRIDTLSSVFALLLVHDDGELFEGSLE